MSEHAVNQLEMRKRKLNTSSLQHQEEAKKPFLAKKA